MRYVSTAIVGGFVVLAICLTAVVVVGIERPAASLGSAEAQEELANPIPRSEESIAAGRIIYARFCRSCHGPTGLGDGGGAPPEAEPSNLVDDEWDHGSTDGEIYKTIREGIPPDLYMEPWEGRITDEDIWNVVNYLRDLGERAKKE